MSLRHLYPLVLLVAIACSQQQPSETSTASAVDTVPQAVATTADTATADTLVAVPTTTDTLRPDTSLANARARYLAGLSDSTQAAFAGLRDSAYWQEHQARIGAAWARFSVHQRNVAKWAHQELAGPQTSKDVLYPFSGPDFAHVFTLFPKAERYTLIGLEPVGALPALETYEPYKQSMAFRRLGKALKSILSASFFITKDMDTVLRGQELRGTTPILHFFMVRMGCHIQDYQLLTLTRGGQMVANTDTARGNAAVRIYFTAPDGSPKQLTYIQGNLNNMGMRYYNPGLAKYLSQLPEGLTYLKSASYLLHSSNFSRIREVLLARSQFILQDDSGIPFANLQPPTWQTRLYGQYAGTIRLFSHRLQPAMKQAYADSDMAGASHPLNFRLGYGTRNQINLQLATRVITPRP